MSPLLSFVVAALSLTMASRAIAAPGEVDASVSLSVNSSVYGVAAQPDGKVIITGSFSTVGGVGRNHVARIKGNGTVDAGFNPNVNVSGTVFSTAVLPDGKILLAGNFSTVGGVARNCIARLNPDGTLDTTFNANLDGIEAMVYCTLVQPDGKFLIGGTFSMLGGVARNNVARFNADGTLDTGFNPNSNDSVYSLSRQPDGKILIAGEFTILGGRNRNYLARVDAAGIAESAFNVSLDEGGGHVNCVAIQADGRIILGGYFSTVRHIQRSCIARINADSTLDTSFNPNANSSVSSMAIQSDGKIIIGGGFTTVGVVTRNRIARLNADGTTDSFFNPNVTGSIYSTLLQPDGKILLGGSFSSVGGTARTNFAQLDNDGATQSLAVQGSTRVEWLRGGSSAEILEVTFERSTDGGSAWSQMGVGTRISGGWELTGLDLPASGLVRARARSMGAYRSASGSLLEATAPFFGGQPEIAVEQPDNTDIVDGGSRDFGIVQIGNLRNVTFTVRNTGSTNLTGLGTTIDGPNAADFSVTTIPTVPVPGPMERPPSSFASLL